ncbi:MAG: hypothetical protein M0017_07465 [Desulfobacteraceae bacterium]|nr:hypothetical protein [Desulfobacteraceae bacterium]
MNRMRPLLILLFLFPLLSGTAMAGKGKFVVFYSNDVHGETEPCG